MYIAACAVKILSDELGGKSSLAFAPFHVYIKHLGEDGKWYNADMTHGGYVRDIWYIETSSISTEAIRHGTFLTALSVKENIAFMIDNLARGYNQKYGRMDEFTIQCADKILTRLPNFCDAIMLKAGTLQRRGLAYIKKYGEKAGYFLDGTKSLIAQLDSLGYSQITDDEYNANVERALQRMEENKQSESQKP